LKSRNDCNRAVDGALYRHPETEERSDARNTLIDEYLANHPYLERYHDIRALRERAVAAHHAGNLPQYKFLVEELMSRGLLTAIFSTSTVSAGVNFPARTVVIPQSDRFNGMNFSDLTATELAQMTGRAGRRGRDLIGFAVILPGPYMNLKLMNALFNSPPNPILSRLDVSFSMVLNLIQIFKADDIKYLLSRSLYAWQSVGRKTDNSLRSATRLIWESFLKHLRFMGKEKLLDKNHQLTPQGMVASKLRFDHPLVYNEAVIKGALPTDPVLLASTVASLIDATANSRAETAASRMPSDLAVALNAFRGAVKPIIERLKKAGFAYPNFHSVKSQAVYEWMTTHDFTAASSLLVKDAGDLVRLLLMTVEYLNQFAALKDDYPGLESSIRKAQLLLMVPPIT
jgi:superfamily II RNA helicase